MAEIVRSDLHDRGLFYHDGRSTYFFFDDNKKLIEIHPDDIEYQLLLARYGINSTETIYRYILEDLRVEAFERGTQTEVHRLAHYNPETFTLSLFNHTNQIYRISPKRIELVDNGTDGVLFLTNSKAQSFVVAEPDDAFSWLDEVIVSKINFAHDLLTPNERRLIFTLWFYALFFESIMPTKPILALIGEKGSGKSITLRKVGMLLFGNLFDVTSLTDDPKDFDAAITNSVFVAIDNADSRCHWLNDRLATVATGGTIKKRELYTTNKLVEIPARCFLAITSRTPHFRRDDVSDRLLIMKVDRFAEMKPEKRFLNEVSQKRDQIMSEVVHHLQEVVQVLHNEVGADYSGTFRMADFADFAVKVARHAGIEDVVMDIFDKLTHEQSFFTLEDDPLFDLLCEWVIQNKEREVTNAELCKELAELAEKNGVDFPYKDKRTDHLKVRSFAQRMRNLRTSLAEFFTITSRSGHADKTYYTYTLKGIQRQHQK